MSSPDLKKLHIFQGIPENRIDTVADCLSVQCFSRSEGESLLPKNARVSLENNSLDDVIIYLAEGSARILQYGYDGKRTILETINADSVVCDTNMVAMTKNNHIDIVATQDCVLLKFSFAGKAAKCSCCVKYVNTIRGNLLTSLSELSSRLMGKICTLSNRSISEKITAYLATEAQKAQSNIFTIGLNRQELADYLCIDRCALSRELGNMRQLGFIDFDGNTFKLLK